MTLFWQLSTGSGPYLAVEKCLRNCGKCREETKAHVWSVRWGGEVRFSGSLKTWVEKRVGTFKMAPAALDNQFRSLMFVVHVLLGTGFYWVFNKGVNKVEANRLKNKTQKNLLGLWIRAFGQSLAVFFVLFCCGCFLWGGGEQGVVFFRLKSCEKGMRLRKKQSFVNSVIEIVLIINSNFTLLLKWLETLLFRLI